MEDARTKEGERSEGSSEAVTRELITRYLSTRDEGDTFSAQENERFISTAVTYQLNPFKRELHAVVTVEDGKRKMNLIVGYEVYIKKAERTGLLDGWKAWVEGAGDTLKAVVEIQRKDWKNPFVHEVYWSEAVQRDDNGGVLDFWARMPKFQLKKVAISQGFRLCFASEIGGIPYDGSELPLKEGGSERNERSKNEISSVENPVTTSQKHPTETTHATLAESIHQRVMKEKTLFSDQHLSWIENQLRSEKTEAQLRGLLKHVEETIASGGDEKGSAQTVPRTPGAKLGSSKRRVPASLSAPGIPREIPVF